MKERDMEHSIGNQSHDKISPTAKLAAYFRSLSEIPFSKEIAEAIQAEQAAKQMVGDKLSMMAKFQAPLIEARYRTINASLEQIKPEVVLEFACGLLPRGLEFAQRSITYIGTDLPDILSESSLILNSIASRLGISKEKFHFQPCNVLNKDEVYKSVSKYENYKVAICNEGLLMYLNMQEKATMAENVREILLQSNGAWITTDIVTRNSRRDLFDSLKSDQKDLVKSVFGDISNQVGRDVIENDFPSEAEAFNFYKTLGFDIMKLPFRDTNCTLSTLSNASSVTREWIDIFDALLSKFEAWILTPKR
jgi:hypothetical protein